MEHASVDDILDRFKQAAKVTTDADLAKVLGLSRQSIAAARLRAKIPASWFPKMSSLFNISTEWLYRGETAQECEKTDVCVNMETDICSQLVALRTYCDKIERKLERAEYQRGEAIEENRKLWKENGELREKCARLEERMDKPLTSRGPAEMGNLG